MSADPRSDEENRTVIPVRSALLYAALAVGAVAAMMPSLFGPFLYDDHPLIAGNHYVHSFRYWTRWVTGDLWSTNYDPREGVPLRGYWRPVTLATYAWDWTLGGGSPLMFHVTNVAVHATNGVLLFIVLKKWCRNQWGALVGAALFVLHPVQTEPVAWISGRTDSVCTLGMLIAVLGWRALGERQRRLTIGWSLLGMGMFVAFGAKEAAITVTALIAVEEWSVRQNPLTGAEVTRLCLRAAPFAALSLVLLIGRSFLVVESENAHEIERWNQAQLVVEAYGRYVQMVFWPADMTFGQALLYRAGERAYRVDMFYVVLGATTVAVLLGYSWRNRLTKPRAALAALLPVALALPVSGLVWLGYAVLVSPRFLYVPMLGVAFGVGCLVAWSARCLSFTRVYVVAALVGALLFVVTFARASDFSSEQALWRAEIERNPHYLPAQEYFVVRELRESRPRRALALGGHFFVSNRKAGFPEAYNVTLGTRLVEGVLQATADADRETLVEVQRFCETLAKPAAAVLDVPALGMRYVIPDEPALMRDIGAQRRFWLLMAAEAASRVGHDAATLEYVDDTLRGCETCWAIADSAAIAQARAGDPEGALAVVRGFRRVAPPGKDESLITTLEGIAGVKPALPGGRGPLVSHYYASLGAFGRAFQAAKEAIESPPSDSPSRLLLAELAVRAGFVEDARRLVGSEMSEEAFIQWVTELEPPVRWRDAPADAEVWIPEIPEVASAGSRGDSGQ